jgi:putative membrane protein
MVQRMLVLLALAILMLGGAATGVAAAAAQPTPNDQDSRFLVQAHRANLFEIQSGKTAQNKASDQTVRNLGQEFVNDHTKLDASVRKVATALNVTLPNRPGPKQRAMLEKVSGLNGTAFDRAWTSAQIMGHRETLAAVNTELQGGSSTEVKQVATDAKPVVQEHLNKLENARGAETGTPGSTPSASGSPSY